MIPKPLQNKMEEIILQSHWVSTNILALFLTGISGVIKVFHTMMKRQSRVIQILSLEGEIMISVRVLKYCWQWLRN